ncbi:hypothetical protein ACN47E_006200 [Coniothyrium glycines]
MRRFSKTLGQRWRFSRKIISIESYTKPVSGSSSSYSSESVPSAAQIEESRVETPDQVERPTGQEFEANAEQHVQTYNEESIGAQQCINDDSLAVAQITEVKRQLKSAHRDLETIDVQHTESLAEEAEELVKEATRHAWQAYRSMVKLEEMLRLTHDRGDANLKNSVLSLSEQERPRTTAEGRQVYIPTGADETKATPLKRSDTYGRLREASHAAENLHGSRKRSLVTVRNVRGDARVLITEVPRRVAHVTPARSLTSVVSCQNDVYCDPPPREHVKERIQREEGSVRITLNDPDRVRRGSCDGVTIADMIMSGFADHRFVLPYFHYIKHHEVRALEVWLADEGCMSECDTIGRTERLLHCIQLLQTGCRYETLAVIFSRTPRQIKESCREVMQGLLRLHGATVNETGDQELYMPLWGIWQRFAITKGKAELYYGFGWVDLAKVLVTLNLYIGRWRMQGRFATEGPAFVWGRFFVSRGMIEQVPQLVNESRWKHCNSGSSEDEDDDDSSRSTICPGHGW